MKRLNQPNTLHVLVRCFQMKNVSKYFAVGGIAAAVDLSIFVFATEILLYDYLAVAPISFFVATLINYFLGILYVFESRVRFSKMAEFWLVMAVSLVGLCINQIILYSCVEHAQVQEVVGKVIATGCVFSWNYSMRRFFIFRQSQDIQ